MLRKATAIGRQVGHADERLRPEPMGAGLRFRLYGDEASAFWTRLLEIRREVGLEVLRNVEQAGPPAS